MAQFRGTVKGSRGQASRLGTRNSGLQTTCNGWHVGCSSYLHYNNGDEQDIITIDLTGGSGSGVSCNLFRGSEVQARKLIACGGLFDPSSLIDTCKALIENAETSNVYDDVLLAQMKDELLKWDRGEGGLKL